MRNREVLNRTQPQKPPIERRHIAVEYGRIMDILTNEEAEYYVVLVAKERSLHGPESKCAILPLGHTLEELTSNFGTPKDLVGRRVRVEFFGNSWRRGIAYLAFDTSLQGVGTAMELPSRGFRYAVAGGGSV